MKVASLCHHCHTHLCPRAWGTGVLWAVFSLLSGRSGSGGMQTGLFPGLVSPAAIVSARAAPRQALPCKQHISFPERRKGKEKESQTCWEARTTCQHEEQTTPQTKCGLSY